MTVLETRSRVLVHTVRAVHATTKAPVPVRAAFANDAPLGWRLRVADGVVVVSRDSRDRAPAAPVVVTLTADDPALRLASPVAAVTLDTANKTHEYAPLPSVVEVRLVKADGTPRAGATVKVRPSTGTDVTLAEVGGSPGTYRADRAWSAAFSPLDVRVGNQSARRVPYDPRSRVQRIRLVDPT